MDNSHPSLAVSPSNGHNTLVNVHVSPAGSGPAVAAGSPDL